MKIRTLNKKKKKRQTTKLKKIVLLIFSTETKTKSTSTREPPWLDVTTATRFMVFDSHLDVNAQAHKPSLLGFCDPCPDERKFLRVRYTYKGVLHEVTIGEDDALAIPNKTHQLPEECQK